MNRTYNFRKMFWRTFIVIITPIIIIGCASAGYFFARLAEDTKQLNISIVEQTREAMDTSLTKLISTIQQMRLNENIKKFIRDNNAKNDIGILAFYEARRELLRYEEIDIVKSLGIYLPSSDFVLDRSTYYSFSEYYDNFLGNSAQSKEWWLERLHETNVLPVFISAEMTYGSRDVIFTLPMDAFQKKKSDAVFIVKINTDTFLDKLTPVFMRTGKAFAILTPQDELLFKTDGFNGNFSSKDGNSLHFSVPSDVLKLTYVFEFPRGGISGGVYRFVVLFMIFFCLGIVASVLLARFGFRRMQRPLVEADEESRRLSDNLNVYIENTQTQILINYLTNIQLSAASKKTSTYIGYGTGITGDRFLVIAASGYELEGKEWADEVISYDLSKVITDIIEESLWKIGVSFRRVILFEKYIYALGYNDAPGIEDALRRAIGEIGVKIDGKFLLGVGVENEALSEIWKSYETAVTALRFADAKKSAVAVYDNDMLKYETGNIRYTREDALALTGNVKSGSSSGVERLLDKLYDINFKQRFLSQSDLKMFIARVVMTLDDIITETYKNQPNEREKFKRVCQNILQNKDPSYGFEIIKDMCASLCKSFSQWDNDEMHGNMLGYIEANYTNPALSLDSMARHLKSNYSYLSRLFKNTVGVNFTGYLVMVRLEKAKELLETTDLPVKEIAEKVGFSNSNVFIRAYKQYYNVTPGEYRVKQGH